MYMPQASRHRSKHWSAGVRPTWVKRTSVPASVAAMSNRISVPVHSFWSSMKLIQLSSTRHTTRLPGRSSSTRIRAKWTPATQWMNSSLTSCVRPARFSSHQPRTSLMAR